MSNSTRPGGYDERLVVPLEASRRGAHRARVNPLVAALPVLAVVIVVAVVIGVAYTLFLKPANSTDDGSSTIPTTSAPAPGGSSSSAPTTSSSASSSSTSASPSVSSSTSGKVDTTLAFRVYNGSVARTTGLASQANTKLQGADFRAGHVVQGEPPVSRTPTTKIYYATSSQKATAEALKEALGVGVVRLNPGVAANGIVVVVGDDYKG